MNHMIVRAKKFLQQKKYKAKLKETTEKDGIILLYHSVHPTDKASETKHLHNITPEVFEQQLTFLQQSFSFVSLDVMFERLQAQKSIQGLASITFDDGYASVLDYAMPILRRLNLHATFFITTSLIEQKILWRDQVRQIIHHNREADFIEFAKKHDECFVDLTVQNFYKQTKSPKFLSSTVVTACVTEFVDMVGLPPPKALFSYCNLDQLQSIDDQYITLGNHTVNHYVLSTLPKDQQYNEINDAKNFLHKIGKPISKIFSIPFGSIETFDQSTVQILNDLGFSGFLLSHGSKLKGAREIQEVLPFETNLSHLTRIMPRSSNGWFSL